MATFSAVAPHSTPAFRQGSQIELSLLEPAEPTSWKCAKYTGAQMLAIVQGQGGSARAWCESMGTSSDEEHQFFGAHGPCGSCWCCKRAAKDNTTLAKSAKSAQQPEAGAEEAARRQVAQELAPERPGGHREAARGEAIPHPRPWQCVRYEEGQDNDWCRHLGNMSGHEYHFFGQDSPCGKCWCCKRELEEAVEQAAERPTSHKSAADEPATAQALVTRKPAADMPSGHKRAAEKLADLRQVAEEPAAERLSGHNRVAEEQADPKQAAQKPAAERLSGDKRVAEEQADRKQAAKEPAADMPSGHKRVAAEQADPKQVAQKPAAERPSGHKRVAEEQADQKQAAKEPAADMPSGHKRVAEEQADPKQAAQKSAADRPSGHKRAAEEQADQKQAAQKPAAEWPSGHKRVAEEQADPKQVAKKPAAEMPSGHKRAAEEQADQKQAAQTPAAERPSGHKRVAEEQADPKQVAEEPAAEMLSGHKRVAEEQAAPHPGPWECVMYEGEQDNDWCKLQGNVSGEEYQFFGSHSPCGECWCCKREIEKKKTCAARHASCLEEQCCVTPGFQCYEKTPDWARCRQWCTPGPDPADTNSDHWSCKSLGPVAEGAPPPIDYELQAAPWVDTYCAGRGENCTDSMCCREAGMQCYAKDKFWSSCKPSCTAGPDPVDADANPWDCEPLGSRTPGAPPGWGPAAPWVAEGCSGLAEDCTQTKCCREPGHQCYAKVPGQWAMCMPSCQHGPLLTDANPDIWDCSPLGGRTPGLARASAEVHVADWVASRCARDFDNCTSSMCCSSPTFQCYAKDDKWAVCRQGCGPGAHGDDVDDHPWSCAGLGPRTPRPWGHPSLYCFAVAQIYSYEGDIIRGQVSTDGGAGIFACEQYDVFSTDAGVFLGDGPMGPVWSQYFDFTAVGTSVDGTSANSRLFWNVWEAVRIVGRYKHTDWTVKVDPDAVVIPDRLRWHLSSHTGRQTYIKTCDKGNGMTPMMFGAVEAISRSAMERYYEGRDSCQGLPIDAWGEDRWLGACLDSLGAPGEADFSMVSDGVCNGVDCGNGMAAFHPFKDVGAWQGCYYQAMR